MRPKRFLRSFVMATCFLYLATDESLAQTNVTGFVTGVVTTLVGEAVPGAEVTATNQETGVRRTVVTPGDGRFRFAALPVGRYSLRAEAEGFDTAERGPIEVNIGSATRLVVSLAATEEVVELGTLTVVGGRTSVIDIESVESTTIITDEMLNRLPVARNLESVALLAPGTMRSTVFGLISFGGASVAENGYYFNGMNLTNFYNGLGGSVVPFEFYREFEVMTGGYGAEFGRTTGGVVNAVSKRGGDVFEFGTGAYWGPDALRESSPDQRDLNPGGFEYSIFGSGEEYDDLSAHVYGSGPIVEDRLFFYALVEYSKSDSYYESGPVKGEDWPTYFTSRDHSEELFWGVKLDWHPNPNHLVELTAFTDARTGINDYSEVFPPTGDLQYGGRGFSDQGGENYILRYTGYYGQNLTLSLLAGQSASERTNRSPNDDIPVAWDQREDASEVFPTDWLNFRVFRQKDRRRMFRFDGEWDGGRHLVRFGLDYELNTSDGIASYSGGIYWIYFDAVPGTDFNGIPIPEGVTQITREKYFDRGGGFDAENTALYLEDHWQVADDWLIYAGIRRETFDNKNALGQTFVEMDDQWGPRLGLSWDVRGDLSGKLYATAGRYFLPMPTRVNLVQAGALDWREDWYVLEGLNPDGTPVKGDLLASRVFADGAVPDVTELLDTDLDPTYQDEFILGYQWEVIPGWSLGVRGIYRELKNAIEDVNFGTVLNEYAAANGYDDFFTDPDFTYVMTNPGTDADLRFDLDYDGVYEEIHLSAAEIGVPKVKRTYKALEWYFERHWKDGWSLQGSYTWSQGRGNYEGWTDSYDGRADGPLMSAFDTPEIMEGAYGKLVSDRPHTLKLFGAWDVTEHWQVSGNFLFQSGVAYGARGCHPVLGLAYGCQYFYADGELVPRGSLGRSDSLYQLDLGLQYSRPLGRRDGRLNVRLDVANVFNADTETGRNESAEFDNGQADLNYLQPNGFQAPRSVRLGLRLDF